MFKYALNLVLRRPLRTLLTSMGVTIAVFLISFIVFGMQDLQSLLVNEFSSRFSPNQVIVTGGDMLSMFGGGIEMTYDQEKVESAIMTQDVVDEIENLPYVNKVNAMLMIMGMDVTLDEKEVPFTGAIMSGWNVENNDPYFVDYWGDEEYPQVGEVWLSKLIVDYYKESPEEIIGKTITIKPSNSAVFSSKSSSLIGKEFSYTIGGVFDPGQDKNDVILSTADAKELLADIGGFESPEKYIENIGYDTLFVDVDGEYHEDFKKLIKDEYNYTGIASDDILDILGSITDGLTIALVMFGLVSAAVAGIGIINTMIMSIYEQTKEIGVIKAIGASNGQVLSVFLIQSGFIGLLGGLVGLGSIFLIMIGLDGVVVDQLMNAGFTIDQFFHFNWMIAGGITLASIIVGIVAGIYPAVRAARLDPIKALRYE